MHGKYHRVGPVSIYPRLILLCICEIWGSPPTHASVFFWRGGGIGEPRFSNTSFPFSMDHLHFPRKRVLGGSVGE